jgi:hypothetical protein
MRGPARSSFLAGGGGRLKGGELVAAHLEESSKWMSGGFIARA